MGMYDTVLVPCPSCGKKAEFQTKGGACNLVVYELEEAPADVLSDINRHGPAICECGTVFKVKVKVKVTVEAVFECNRCGHAQESSFQCGVCGWGDLYPEKDKEL